MSVFDELLAYMNLGGKAIDFAKEQHDDDLWEDLLKYSETRPRALV